ncbi:MAG: divalent metal cation transporter [Bacteroidetes bacterium]|nr:divalent metal cation transporter [Bacteroidota bacterium]
MSKGSSLTKKIKLFFSKLGPGLVTGASDDDPSGIATYTQAGAKFGTNLLWTAIVTYPLMVNIQEMCARVGIITGKGITGTIKSSYPKSILYILVLASFPAITLNIGADIAAMGAVGNLIIPQVAPFVFSIFFTLLLIFGIIYWSYTAIAKILKWLCLVLFCYLIIPFTTKTNWLDVIQGTFIPQFKFEKEYFIALVGILGTTISPYLFFWQANMEVEEKKHRKHIIVDKKLISDMQTDIKGGMLLTNVVFYFIILTSGTVLFKAGITDVETVEQAAQALKPLAGEMAYALFALGVIGTGLLAIPVLAGSLSYMFAEAFDWEEGLDKKFSEAKGFYFTMVISMLLGLAIHLTGVSPVKALYYSAVLYGITAPVLIGIILHIANNKKLMKHYVNTKKQNFFGFTTLLVMAACSGILLYLLF